MVASDGSLISPITASWTTGKHWLARLSVLFLFLTPLPCLADTDDPCDGYDAALLINTESHIMWMCRENRASKAFRVSLGRGGVAKQSRGDEKTPLGEYELGAPRSSERYRLFIPVGYPNADQVAKGYSGGNIGIHGPHRKILWLGKDSAAVDWTLGCIAVGTDDEIAEVAHWLSEQKVTRVVIH